MQNPAAIFPAKHSALGIHSLAREMQAMAAVSLNPPPFPSDDFPRGRGRPVLVIPGFLAGDWTTARLRQFLRLLDYRVETADILFNAGPTRGIIAKLEKKLASLAARAGTPASLIGVSLGGALARQLARCDPARVRQVITLCSPIRFPVTTPLQPFAFALAPFHEAGWVAQRDDIWRALPVPVTALYSEEDGIVDWRQCLQEESPLCENVCVDGAHMTVCSNPLAQAAIARALGASVSASTREWRSAPEAPSRQDGAAPDR